MNIADEIKGINDQLERIWNVVKHYPNNIGFASNLDAETKKMKRRTTKDDIKVQLIKNWNKDHPHYKINN
ncbi:hypothetical protein FAM09_24680 [Niastella caeni]|uniref:Uncharacterized protein n=1 Tax=Niastella caeni TaxID=2569763 RepID=A0A4S8HGD1_9BACT|nr:hypothetical protein [Niastella caeni]THU34218.1 hypothetical protein FAM09_24680 [Niastella caeni]